MFHGAWSKVLLYLHCAVVFLPDADSHKRFKHEVHVQPCGCIFTNPTRPPLYAQGVDASHFTACLCQCSQWIIDQRCWFALRVHLVLFHQWIPAGLVLRIRMLLLRDSLYLCAMRFSAKTVCQTLAGLICARWIPGRFLRFMFVLVAAKSKCSELHLDFVGLRVRAVYMYVHVYSHTYIHAYIHAYIHTYTWTYVYTHLHTYMRTTISART